MVEEEEDPLQTIQNEYEDTIPTPCNWPRLVCLYLQIKYLQRKSKPDSTPVPPSSSEAHQTSNHDSESTSKEDSLLIQKDFEQLSLRIDRLKRIAKNRSERTYVHSLENKIVAKDFDLCAICLDSPTHPVLTDCGHVYCKFCMNMWHQKATALFCPLCKVPIEPDKILTIPNARIVKAASFPWPWNRGKTTRLILVDIGT
eukprot:TRINITY_DN16054_c0_g1_i1.p1 TRINITY_DN16054_c0_g1~~TRINITY_DN16054_c0_g1_i1.p1  ORF type:complete len:200 (-),score=33.64 TRINITY_DN16054_c0_g1_i1:118-717(-)